MNTHTNACTKPTESTSTTPPSVVAMMLAIPTPPSKPTMALSQSTGSSDGGKQAIAPTIACTQHNQAVTKSMTTNLPGFHTTQMPVASTPPKSNAATPTISSLTDNSLSDQTAINKIGPLQPRMPSTQASSGQKAAGYHTTGKDLRGVPSVKRQMCDSSP
ncbi:hypothetical protein H2248_011410, partial [Termitomyces sp. 'cryptogamus']